MEHRAKVGEGLGGESADTGVISFTGLSLCVWCVCVCVCVWCVWCVCVCVCQLVYVIVCCMCAHCRLV